MIDIGLFALGFISGVVLYHFLATKIEGALTRVETAVKALKS